MTEAGFCGVCGWPSKGASVCEACEAPAGTAPGAARDETNVWILGVGFYSRLVRVPRAAQEPFFGFLLTLNDKTSGPCSVGLDGDVVTLSITEPTAFLNQDTGTAADRRCAVGRVEGS